MRMLDREKVSYQVYEYDHQGPVDGVAVATQLQEPLEMVYKTLVTKGKSGNYFVFVIPVAEELNLKKAASVVGEKSVEMIPVKEIFTVTGYIRGGCSPIGMKKLYTTVIQQDASKLASIIVSGGKIGTQIQLSPYLLQNMIHATMADIIEERN